MEFFHLQIAVDSEFFERGVWAPTYFGHTKFEVKNFLGIFFIYKALFLVTLNLMSKIFQNFFIYRELWTLKFS